MGETTGIVNILDREFNLDGFAAYTGTILALVQVVSRNLLVTVGLDKESPLPSVKIWNMDREGKGGSRLLRTIRLQGAPDKVAVTCLAVLDDVTQVVVGMSGAFLRGSLSLRVLTPLPPSRRLRDAHQQCGFGARQYAQAANGARALGQRSDGPGLPPAPLRHRRFRGALRGYYQAHRARHHHQQGYARARAR